MIETFLGTSPSFDETNFIAPNATVIGDVVLGRQASIWFNLSAEEVASIARYAENYLRYSAIYRGEEKPNRNPFYEPA
jgi:carbonic anhydrase/acetyltransferase-like protein (isoleucine patch superfamily)